MEMEEEIKQAIKERFLKRLHENLEKVSDEDNICMNSSLFIRMLELAREEIKSDRQLHFVAEKSLELAQAHGSLTMDDYDEIESALTQAQDEEDDDDDHEDHDHEDDELDEENCDDDECDDLDEEDCDDDCEEESCNRNHK